MLNDIQIPELRNPWMLAAFEGWNDAAEAASAVVDHLIESWDAELLLELDPEDYFSFQEPHLRPQVIKGEHAEPVITWPTPRIYVAHRPDDDRDVLILRSPEPSFHWKAFCSTVVGVAKLAGVSELYTIGALLSDVPHTRPVPVSGLLRDREMMDRVSLEASRYTGPVGITMVLNDFATGEGILTALLWAAVPHYVAEPPCPKATLALLDALEDAVGTPLPHGALAELADAWQRGAEELADQDAEIAEYVESLEDEREPFDLPEASGDAIAKQFERYLRHRKDN